MTAISQLRDECESIYYQTSSYRVTAKILCDRYPDIPNLNHVRGLIPIVLSDDPDDYEDEEFDTSDSDLQKERDLLRIERTRVRNEVRRSNAFQELRLETLKFVDGNMVSMVIRDYPENYTRLY